jgi:hypothetical protein
MSSIERMSEAEVSLRLAHHLVAAGFAQSRVIVALDGAQVGRGEVEHFGVAAFLSTLGWSQVEGATHWRCNYRSTQGSGEIEIHSRSGCGDVTCTLMNGVPLIVEAKKGTLSNSKSSSEYPLLREALGQLLTLEAVPTGALLAVAVPHSPKFVSLAARWRVAPLIAQAGIRILTVARSGEVIGW